MRILLSILLAFSPVIQLRAQILAPILFGNQAVSVTPWNYVQTAADGASGAATTLAKAQTTNPTTGDLIIVFAGGTSGTANTSPTVADSRSNTYTEITGCKIVYGFYTIGTVFYAYNVTGGAANTVTVTYPNSTTNRSILITEYGGLKTASTPLDACISQNQVAPLTGTDVLTSTNLTVAVSGELLLGFTVNVNGSAASITVSSGFTSRFNGHPSFSLQKVQEDKTPSAGTNAVTFTLNDNGTDAYFTYGVAFKLP